MSYLFDATAEKLTGTFTTALDVTAAGGDGESVTLAMWFKIADHPLAQKYFLSLGTSNTVTTSSIELTTGSTDNAWLTYIFDDATNPSGAQVITSYDGVWVPWIGIYTTETNRECVIGDNTNQNFSSTSRALNAMTYIAVHDSPNLAGAGMNCNIAEVAIWDSALTDAEQIAYMAGNPASEINATRLRGYWPLDTDRDTEGTYLNDSGGLDATGTLTIVGGATYATDHPALTTISRIGSESSDQAVVDTNWTTRSVGHTVPSGCTLLIVTISMDALYDLINVTDVQWNTSETMTLIHATTNSNINGDCSMMTFGLVSPTAATANIDFSLDSSVIWTSTIAAVNYSGTETSSVAAATNFIDEDVNDADSTTLTFTSGGTAGNILYAAGQWHIHTADPITFSDSFIKFFEYNTASTSTAEQMLAIGQKAGVSGVTLTSSATDECAGHMIEIVAAKGRVYVNDAATKDGGEVLQTYPGGANWAETLISMQNAIDTTGLTGQLYVGVENARRLSTSGVIAWRAITVGASGEIIYVPTGPIR